jgi:transposase InsO family protein
MAAWNRGGLDLEGLRAHSDAGSQFTSILWGEQLAQLGAVPSIGTAGDSYDNALAETANGYYKAELIYGPDQGPGTTSTRSNSPPSPGPTGTTTSASTVTAATSLRPSSRPPTLPNQPTNFWLGTYKPSLRKTQGDSTYAEAKAWFDTYYPYYGDVARLDADGDLEPCESLPGGP